VSVGAPDENNVFEAKLHKLNYFRPCSEYLLNLGGNIARSQGRFPGNANSGRRVFARIAPDHRVEVVDSQSSNGER
jgi:hypothetical protein